jgi:hypothetical protein
MFNDDFSFLRSQTITQYDDNLSFQSSHPHRQYYDHSLGMVHLIVPYYENNLVRYHNIPYKDPMLNNIKIKI